MGDGTGLIERAAAIIREAEVFIITAGAGMGVDSGLPDFRGDHGFWQAYPAYAQLGLSFVECANPEHFIKDPHFAWGFYGYRTNLYRETIPHDGFNIIKKWIKQKGGNMKRFIATATEVFTMAICSTVYADSQKLVEGKNVNLVGKLVIAEDEGNTGMVKYRAIRLN